MKKFLYQTYCRTKNPLDEQRYKTGWSKTVLLTEKKQRKSYTKENFETIMITQIGFSKGSNFNAEESTQNLYWLSKMTMENLCQMNWKLHIPQRRIR